MDEKILTLTIYQESEYSCPRRQEMSDKENGISFYVADLCECPEDATIGRDLFSAHEYIAALNKGIKLASKGYTAVDCKVIDEDEA